MIRRRKPDLISYPYACGAYWQMDLTERRKSNKSLVFAIVDKSQREEGEKAGWNFIAGGEDQEILMWKEYK